MAKATFYNLPAEKREGFLNAAFKEFSEHSFKQASISRMVKDLGIAKGSVYQYFRDKADLYEYLNDMSQDVKMEYVLKAMEEDYYDFFDLFEKMFMAGIRFDLENPRESRFLYVCAQEWDNEKLGNMRRQNFERNIRANQQLLEKELKGGRLRKDIDVDTLAFTVTQLSQGISDWLEHKLEIKVGQEMSSDVYEEKEEAILAEVRQMIEVMKTGFWNM